MKLSKANKFLKIPNGVQIFVVPKTAVKNEVKYRRHLDIANSNLIYF